MREPFSLYFYARFGYILAKNSMRFGVVFYELFNDYSYKQTLLVKMSAGKVSENKTGALINSWLDTKGTENVAFKLPINHVEMDIYKK